MKNKSIYKSIILISVAILIFVNGVFPEFVTQTGYTYLASFLAIICAISFAMYEAHNKVVTKRTILLGIGLLLVVVMWIMQYFRGIL